MQRGFAKDEAQKLLSEAFAEVRAVVANVGRVLSKESTERAFGQLGESGDPEIIKHLARRVTDIYGALLDWSLRLRGAGMPEEYEDVVEIAASFVDQPIQQVRDFVDLGRRRRIRSRGSYGRGTRST